MLKQLGTGERSVQILNISSKIGREYGYQSELNSRWRQALCRVISEGREEGMYICE